MCGRFTLTQSNPQVIQQTFQLTQAPEGLTPRYNIAPTQPVAAVAHDEHDQRKFGWMRWGLIPSWSKDASSASGLINARAESVHEKPSFRAAFKRRRCLVIADGFYEWRKNDDGSKTPMHIRLADGSPFAIAGLWERWTEPESGEDVITCTLITTTPNRLMADIHNRMPVILPPDAYDVWLDRHLENPDTLRHLLIPYDPAQMIAYAVSKKVNNPAYDGPDLIERVQ